MSLRHGFTYEFSHDEHFDPRCAVCTTSTEILHKVLGEWLDEAVFLDQGMDYSKVDLRKLVLLKPSPKPFVERVGEWFVENFNDTIKFASINKVLFRECDTNIGYEFIIEH